MNSVIAKTRAEAKALGLGIYHSGKPCPHGHNDGRYASGGQCVTCTFIRRQEAAKDREKEREARRRYMDRNRDTVLARRRAYNQENIEKERARRRTDYHKHADKRAASTRRFKEANRDHVIESLRVWREKNADHIRNYNLKNSHLRTAASARRRARHLKATPKWLTRKDGSLISAIYRQARQLSKETGIMHEVDHIIPLQGKLVCGLHVPGNLRITTRSDNRSKRNFFVPEMLEAA